MLVWQDKSIPLYPWDTTDLVLHRIAQKENIAVSYIRVSQDLHDLMQTINWEEDVDIPIDVSVLSHNWDDVDMVTTMKKLETDPDMFSLFVRYKTEKDEIDEQLWDTLFRHDFQDMSFSDWQEQLKQQIKQEKENAKQAKQISKVYMDLSMAEPRQLLGWKSEQHRIQYKIEDIRSLEELFANVRLGDTWRLALLHQKHFQWGETKQWIVKMRRLKDPSLEELTLELEDNKTSMETGIYLYHQDFETPVFLQPVGNNLYEVELEESDQYANLIVQVQEAFQIGTIKKRTDVGMVGHFIFPQLYIDFPLFQDMCLNDPVLSHFLFINELRKATFDVVMGVSFRQSIKDVFGMETIKNYDFSIKNTHRQSGFQLFVSLQTPLSEKYLPLFFLLMCQIMGRYLQQRDKLLQEYTTFIPTFKTTLDKTQKSLIKNIKATRPEYITKYPRMFVRNLYSVICQKNLQPTLLSEDETYNVPPESFLKFPPEPIAEINPEYYYCPNKDYPFAGLKEMDLKGQDIFINLAPCCFNSPQEKENERKLAKLRTKDDMEDDETSKKASKSNIISGKFLIKHVGQLGTVRPPSMNRFFMAYDPFCDYYRIGIEQSPSSLISCLLTRRNMSSPSTTHLDVAEVRLKMSQDTDCVVACLQENPGLSVEDIRQDIANVNVYFDPRRFYRAVELYFSVRLLIFSKEQDMMVEDAQLWLPFSMRTHYTNHSDLPYTIIFEHWGGKTNILSRFKHPHCELIGFKSFTQPTMRFDFSPKGVCQLFDNVVSPFDGNRAIQPFYRKQCWFFRYIIAQSTDPLGKVRWLHFQYYNQTFYAEISPPLAVQNDVPFASLPEDIPVINAQQMLRFLSKFDHWESIDVPNIQEDVIYWSVSQDNVFWKSLEEHSKVVLTFACRLPKPQPQSITDRDDTLQKYIHVQLPTTMLYRPSTSSPSIWHDGKIANLLSQLVIHAFSVFLKENKVRSDATDVDVLLTTFSEQQIRMDPSHVYPETLKTGDYGGFMRGKKIVLPSGRFWEKLMFHLRWLMFYHPHYLFNVEETKPKPLQTVSDFSQEDPKHYYCHLNSLQNVLKYSIENLYDLVTCPIHDLPSFCKKQNYVIWYDKKLSPYASPSLVMLYPSYVKTVLAIRLWRQEKRIVSASSLVEEDEVEDEQNIREFVPTLNQWQPTTTEEEPMFRARVADDEFLLFFPIE